MTDRELLENAAKAAGIRAVYECAFGFGEEVEQCRLGLFNRSDGGFFNSLTEDSDAFRLVVALEMEVEVNQGHCFARSLHGSKEGFTEFDKNDSRMACRRAITRAAAEVGAAKADTGASDER